MKSIYLQKDKLTFDLSEYPAEEFAASMGLPGAPQIKFGNQKVKEKKRGGEAAPEEIKVETVRDVVASDDESEEDEDVVNDDDISESGEEEVGSSSESDEIPTVSLSSLKMNMY
jgi:ATP-dependent RNA helicase DDX10/DBP4